ncbi:MAG: TatD family hydrolase, partial [Lachnospiraceae bacterium]|nr:TatD family hydrolase [Lachnospiraceae bacterium]
MAGQEKRRVAGDTRKRTYKGTGEKRPVPAKAGRGPETDRKGPVSAKAGHGSETEGKRPVPAKAGRMPAGIMHCYTGSWESAKVYLDLGLYISLSGAVTFKNAPKLAEVAVNTPADRLLVETDCPYMAPVPLRGQRNEPAFVTHTFARVAQLRGESPDALAERLWENACRILRL